MSIEDLAVVCAKNTVVKQIVEKFNDDKVIEINVAKDTLDREHSEVLSAFKVIAKTECAKLTIGRRGQQTRIRWTQDIKAITTNTEDRSSTSSIATASLEELIVAIKTFHNVSSVHLVY